MLKMKIHEISMRRAFNSNSYLFPGALGFRMEILPMKWCTELETPLSEMVQITAYFATFHKISKMKEGSAPQRAKRPLGNVGKSGFSKKSL